MEGEPGAGAVAAGAFLWADKEAIRNMLPFTVRCLTCGEFMFAGTKFNTPQERAGDYLGVPIYRFYYRCPKCSAEFTLCTDPENESYVVEAGVTRPFGGSDPIRTFRQTAHAAAEEMETEAAAGAAGDGAGAPRASKAEAMAAVESRAAEMRKQAEADDEVEALYERRRQEAVLGPDAMIAMVQRGEVGAGRVDGADDAAVVAIAVALLASGTRALPTLRFWRLSQAAAPGGGALMGKQPMSLQGPLSLPPRELWTGLPTEEEARIAADQAGNATAPPVASHGPLHGRVCVLDAATATIARVRAVLATGKPAGVLFVLPVGAEAAGDDARAQWRAVEAALHAPPGPSVPMAFTHDRGLLEGVVGPFPDAPTAELQAAFKGGELLTLDQLDAAPSPSGALRLPTSSLVLRAPPLKDGSPAPVLVVMSHTDSLPTARGTTWGDASRTADAVAVMTRAAAALAPLYAPARASGPAAAPPKLSLAFVAASGGALGFAPSAAWHFAARVRASLRRKACGGREGLPSGCLSDPTGALLGPIRGVVSVGAVGAGEGITALSGLRLEDSDSGDSRGPIGSALRAIREAGAAVQSVWGPVNGSSFHVPRWPHERHATARLPSVTLLAAVDRMPIEPSSAADGGLRGVSPDEWGVMADADGDAEAAAGAAGASTGGNEGALPEAAAAAWSRQDDDAASGEGDSDSSFDDGEDQDDDDAAAADGAAGGTHGSSSASQRKRRAHQKARNPIADVLSALTGGGTGGRSTAWNGFPGKGGSREPGARPPPVSRTVTAGLSAAETMALGGGLLGRREPSSAALDLAARQIAAAAAAALASAAGGDAAAAAAAAALLGSGPARDAASEAGAAGAEIGALVAGALSRPEPSAPSSAGSALALARWLRCFSSHTADLWRDADVALSSSVSAAAAAAATGSAASASLDAGARAMGVRPVPVAWACGAAGSLEAAAAADAAAVARAVEAGVVGWSGGEGQGPEADADAAAWLRSGPVGQGPFSAAWAEGSAPAPLRHPVLLRITAALASACEGVAGAHAAAASAASAEVDAASGSAAASAVAACAVEVASRRVPLGSGPILIWDGVAGGVPRGALASLRAEPPLWAVPVLPLLAGIIAVAASGLVTDARSAFEKAGVSWAWGALLVIGSAVARPSGAGAQPREAGEHGPLAPISKSAARRRRARRAN
ncbi:hypothetical protein FNF29_06537 [Cafeteria roenbergensis]|uniref:Uncharacterized protein n=1 Tax=Cafeteria roenbergensis TaxID=33653 RepID=A0A5A8C7I1_CAFRO|nr:hypothetical protein FNF29_06537 [Cafeteria roenbergensis]|eukprot:KAA0148755.1 hypothetical protein FNF29_06537 [Cafeteria roenbergensis]